MSSQPASHPASPLRSSPRLKGVLLSPSKPVPSPLRSPSKGASATPASPVKPASTRPSPSRGAAPPPPAARPRSAFMQFRAAVYPAVSSSGAFVGVAALGKELGRLWRELPAEEKATYEALYQADKAAWGAAHPDGVVAEKGASTPAKQSGGDAPPPSPPPG